MCQSWETVSFTSIYLAFHCAAIKKGIIPVRILPLMTRKTQTDGRANWRRSAYKVSEYRHWISGQILSRSHCHVKAPHSEQAMTAVLSLLSPPFNFWLCFFLLYWFAKQCDLQAHFKSSLCNCGAFVPLHCCRAISGSSGLKNTSNYRTDSKKIPRWRKYKR